MNDLDDHSSDSEPNKTEHVEVCERESHEARSRFRKAEPNIPRAEDGLLGIHHSFHYYHYYSYLHYRMW